MPVDSSLLKHLILENQQAVLQKPVTPRPLRLDASASYLFTGARGVGKSYAVCGELQQLLASRSIEPQDLLCVNFADDRLAGFDVTDFDRLLAAYHELFGSARKPLLFLDEPQTIPGWEKFARRLADTGHRTLLVASATPEFSTAIHTTLGARYLMREIGPCSFREFLRFHAIDVTPLTIHSPEARDIRRLFDDYLAWGGLPAVFALPEKREWLRELRRRQLTDVARELNLRSTEAFACFIRLLAQNVMHPVPVTELLQQLQAGGVTASKNSLVLWLAALKRHRFIESLANGRSEAPQRVTLQKHYFCDNGLLNCFLSDPLPQLFENAAALALLRRSSDHQVFYWRRRHAVDFWLPDEGLAVQTAPSLADPRQVREKVQGFAHLAGEMPVKRCVLLTMDDEKPLETNGLAINVIPLWKWLLDDDQA